MHHHSRLFFRRENPEPSQIVPDDQPAAFLPQGVSIKGSIKFLNEIFIDGEVKGTIDSAGTLTIGEHARIRGNVTAKSVKARGTVEGNIFATERCELQAGCTLHGDIAAPLLVVDETVTFCGDAKVGNWKSLSASCSPAKLNGKRLRKGSQRSRVVVTRAYDDADNMISAHEHAG
jgi:cytoskeletal protein CcmA (bactofilin family)